MQDPKVKPSFLNLRKLVTALGSPETPDLSRCPSPLSLTSPRYQNRNTSQLSYIVVAPTTPSSGARSVTSLLRHVESPTNRLTDENMLPYWSLYVGWAGVLVTCIASAAVTFMYALQFGEDKTRKWLLSLTISVVNDVFIAQPLKVLAVTIVLAYVLKRPLKERYANYGAITQDTLETSSIREEEIEAPDVNLCSADEFLREARAKREKEKFIYNLTHDVFWHVCFTVLVLIIAYGQKDMGYHMTATQENTFVDVNFKEQSSKKQNYRFHQVEYKYSIVTPSR